MQPAFQHTAAHRRDGFIQHRRQGIVHAARQVLRNLQITSGGGVHNDAVLLTFHGQGADMGQGGALRIFYILQQAACRAQRQMRIFDTEAG